MLIREIIILLRQNIMHFYRNLVKCVCSTQAGARLGSSKAARKIGCPGA